jgi:hypothetical protein
VHFYLRIGRFHDAEAQILAMLAAKPAAPDLANVRSLFALLANYPDLTVPVAAKAPAICATMNNGTSDGRIPAKVSDNERAIVTAGFANEVDAVNQ